MKRPVVVGGAIALALIVAIVAALAWSSSQGSRAVPVSHGAASSFSPAPTPSPTPPAHDVGGVFTLLSGDVVTSPNVCQGGNGGYSDITSATQATLYNGSGTIIAVTNIGTGSPQGTRCVWTFDFGTVPDQPFYAVEIGHRGKISYSLSQMRGALFGVSVSLGS